MKIEEKYQKCIGQGENSDLCVLGHEYDLLMDKYFGIDYLMQESILKTGDQEELYIDHRSEALLTSYLDYYQILMDLGEEKTLIDLGAGYCRGSLLASIMEGKYSCQSIEVAKTRIQAAQDFLNKEDDKNSIFCLDFLDEKFKLPTCDAIFIYLPVGKLIHGAIRKMIESEQSRYILYCIESHGDLIEYFKFYPDLFTIEKTQMKVSIPRHDPYIYKIYVKVSKKVKNRYKKLNKKDFIHKDTLALWMIKYSHLDIWANIKTKVIGSDKTRVWQANLKDSYLMKYHCEFSLQLKSPARILQLESWDEFISE